MGAHIPICGSGCGAHLGWPSFCDHFDPPLQGGEATFLQRPQALLHPLRWSPSSRSNRQRQILLAGTPFQE